MKKATWLGDCLIQLPCNIAICDSEAQFLNILKKIKLSAQLWPVWIADKAEGCTHLFSDEHGDMVCVICVRKGLSRTCTIGIIVHEAVHAWQLIKNIIAEDKPSDEFEAYAIQNLSQRLISAYFERAK